MNFKLDDKDQAIIDAVRRAGLRHPGAIAPRILKLCKPGGTLTPKQLGDIKMAYYNLGLGKLVQVVPSPPPL